MKTLGLIGGTSWRATVEYYGHINLFVNDYFGNNTNPPLLVYTLNQSLIHQLQKASNWSGIADILIEAANKLMQAGADKIMFCANTPHKVYDAVEAKIDVPLLHIADATADAVKSEELKKVCFLGTKYTMMETFITQRIANHGIEVVTPNNDNTITELHRIIHEELTYGTFNTKSKEFVLEVIRSFANEGAEGVVLGCTEFPLMIDSADLPIEVFDSAKIHAIAGANFILEDYPSHN